MGTGERSVAEQDGQRDRAGTAIAFRFRVERDRSAIGRFNDSLERELRDAIPQIALRALQVALDELLTNVVMHARQAAGPIEVAVSRSPETLDTQISYLADGFDPTTRIRRTWSEASFRQAAFQLDQMRAVQMATLAPAKQAIQYAQLGSQYLAQGLIPEAEQEFQTALKADANNAAAHAGIAEIRERHRDFVHVQP